MIRLHQHTTAGLKLTILEDVLNEKRIKVIINGGALNPSGLARKTQALVTERGYDLKVAYVYGDDFRDEVKAELERTNKLPQHLDGENNDISLMENATALLDTKGKPIVSANVYLGARGIVKGNPFESWKRRASANKIQVLNSVPIS